MNCGAPNRASSFRAYGASLMASALPWEAVGTEPTDGSPTGRRDAMETAVTVLALVLLLMVIDRMRRL